jgi:uncharacterized protein YabN with tetrapyrrole methylase and pyrophosphatase domain
MATLRSEQGCPWDREQTHESLTPYLIEEAYETLECIEEGSMSHLREELGDLLLQVVFHAQLARERGDFGIDEVCQGIVDKMVRRHPHVFGDSSVDTASGVLTQWEQIKQQEKAAKLQAAPASQVSPLGQLAAGDGADAGAEGGPEHGLAAAESPEPFVSLLDGMPRQLPALLAAERLSGRAAEVGFRWDAPHQALDKVAEELAEVLEAHRQGEPSRIREELGDLLFATANACRMLGVIAEDALREANQKFRKRFLHLEKTARRRGVSMPDIPRDEQLLLWVEAKNHEPA